MTERRRPLRSNFPRGSYLWSVRNAHWRALGIPEADCENEHCDKKPRQDLQECS